MICQITFSIYTRVRKSFNLHLIMKPYITKSYNSDNLCQNGIFFINKNKRDFQISLLFTISRSGMAERCTAHAVPSSEPIILCAK